MNQQCKVCGEPAAGFHFGAFTCEGCKSFFGRSYNNLSSISECKNNGECVINKKNRTSCKACRLRKCLLVGMSKSGSRYGRRSNWFKIHCLLQEQQQQQQKGAGDNLLDHRLQFQLASIANKEDLKLFDDYAKSPSVSSPESHNSDSSVEADTKRGLGGGLGALPQGGLFRHQAEHHHLPLLPLVLPHPAFLPPPFPGGHHLSSYSFLGKSHLPFQYDDNFNKRFLVEAVLGGRGARGEDDAPIDLSVKSPERAHSPQDDISVDDYPQIPNSPPSALPSTADLLRRTAPLDLTTKVV